MSTIDLGIAERIPDVHNHSGVNPNSPTGQPAALNGAPRQDDVFYVGSVKIEPLEPAQLSAALGIKA